ncbi:DUF1207 domain-containing protein [Adhaeretor mobilis]|nr:DUF1207 domain-containing protein [Adhaeretor mobilis]
MTRKRYSAIALTLIVLVGICAPRESQAKGVEFSSKDIVQGSAMKLGPGPGSRARSRPNDELSDQLLAEELLAEQIPLQGEMPFDNLGHEAEFTKQVQYEQALCGCQGTGGSDCTGLGCCCGHDYAWRLLPQGVIYRSYLAGAKESRFRSVWNNQKADGDNWDISLGGRATIVRYGTSGNVRPEGFELGIEGAGLTRLDPDEDHDVAATDYRFGIPLTWGDSHQQFKVAYYHLSSHVGDEFILKNPTFDRLNYSRDVIVIGYSVYPREKVRLYGEAGYAFRDDVAEPWEFQFGIDYAPVSATGFRGAPFAAVNGHLREEVDFGGNFVVQAGWAWRRSPASGMFRLGMEYYNGKDDQFSFFDNSVQKTGFGVWYDY